MRLLRLVLTLFPLFAVAQGTEPTGPGILEESVCGSFREPLAFLLWSSAAGKPNPGAARRVPNAEPITHKTKDGRLLRGYKLRSTAADGVVRGSVLVAQGNAMLADQLLSSLNGLSTAGIETLVFDYRGYGNSEGQRRLKAMVSDYTELYESMSAATKGSRLLYGISFGGVVLLNVVGSGVSFERAVIDSTPSRVSHLGCPEKYDPVANFPQEGSRFLLVAGGRDKVVSPKDTQELIDLAKARGSLTEVQPDYAHPFMDSDIAVHQRRLELIKSFLVGTASQGAR